MKKKDFKVEERQKKNFHKMLKSIQAYLFDRKVNTDFD